MYIFHCHYMVLNWIKVRTNSYMFSLPIHILLLWIKVSTHFFFLLLLLHLLKRYRPLWTLASSLPRFPTLSDHCPPFFLFPLYLNALQLRPFIFYVAFLLLFSVIVAVVICFGIRWFFILSIWPYHLSRRQFINFRVLPVVISSSSSFLFFSILLLLSTHFPCNLPFR